MILKLTKTKLDESVSRKIIFIIKFINKWEKWNSLWEEWSSEFVCHKWISPALTLSDNQWTWGDKKFYDKITDSWKQWSDECNMCQDYRNYWTICKDTSLFPFEGQCKCRNDGEIMSSNGEWIWAPNFYNSSNNRWYQICQNFYLLDIIKDKEIKIGKIPKTNLLFDTNTEISIIFFLI